MPAGADCASFTAIKRILKCIKKQSPDVETPGLLVKALISSYFMMTGSLTTLINIFLVLQI